MIAKFTLSLLSTWLSVLAWSQSISTKEFHYYYQVAADYHIHPPSLEYGYPWWYDADDLPVTGIIFLKNDLDVPLEKLNDTAWVAEPSTANAREIAAFSTNIGEKPKFLIIPDTSLTYYQVNEFIDSLMTRFEMGFIVFVADNGNHIPVYYEHLKPVYPFIIYCGDRNDLSIYVNSSYQFLCEGKLNSFDSLMPIVKHYYIANWYAEKDPRAWSHSGLNSSKLTVKINQFQEILKANPTDIFLMNELENYKFQLELVQRYGEMTALVSNAIIHLECPSYSHRIEDVFAIFNQIQKGVFEARKDKFSHWNYSQLYALRQFDKLKYIHFQLPDLITNRQRELYEQSLIAPPPPVLDHLEPYTPTPEESEIYKQMMSNPNKLEINELISSDTLN